MYIIDKLFLTHPRNVHMSYLQHMCFSCSIGSYFCLGSCQAYIHGCCPFLFETSSQDCAYNIYTLIKHQRTSLRTR